MHSVSHEQVAVKTIYFSIATSVALALIKWLVGYFGNSYALIADALESTSDVFSSFVVLLGIKYASKPADKNHPYGHGRAEPLVVFFVVVCLVILAGVIAHDSIQNILNPHELPKPYTLIVLSVIILWKEISYRIVLKKSKQTGSTSLKADAWHHRSDAITSVAAFVGISVALVLGKGYEAADDWAALFASAFILYNCYFIFRPALAEIMDEHVYDDLIASVRKISKEVPGVIDTEKCFVRKVGMKFLVDLHAVVSANISVKEGHAIAHTLKDTLENKLPQLGYVFIHIEPDEV